MLRVFHQIGFQMLNFSLELIQLDREDNRVKRELLKAYGAG
jgi:hypothetical protein